MPSQLVDVRMQDIEWEQGKPPQFGLTGLQVARDVGAAWL
jgi:hypothetical protein